MESTIFYSYHNENFGISEPVFWRFFVLLRHEREEFKPISYP